MYLLDDEEFAERATFSERGQSSRTKGGLFDIFHKEVEYLDIVKGEIYKPTSVNSFEVDVKTFENRGRLSLICASPRLFEVQEIAAEIVVSRIKDWLETLRGKYNRIIIDCPPSISSLSLSALKAAEKILVPMPADQFSVNGLPLLLRSLHQYKGIFEIEARIAGVVLSMFPLAKEKSARTKADQFKVQIQQLCTTSRISCLSSKISKDAAYPESFVSQQPLPFNPSKHKTRIDEIDQLAIELKLVGGDPQ